MASKLPCAPACPGRPAHRDFDTGFGLFDLQKLSVSSNQALGMAGTLDFDLESHPTSCSPSDTTFLVPWHMFHMFTLNTLRFLWHPSFPFRLSARLRQNHVFGTDFAYISLQKLCFLEPGEGRNAVSIFHLFFLFTSRDFEIMQNILHVHLYGQATRHVSTNFVHLANFDSKDLYNFLRHLTQT